MRKTNLTLISGDGISVHFPEGMRITKALRSIDNKLDVMDPLAKRPEEERLKILFRRCVEGNVISIPNVFLLKSPDMGRRFGH